MFSCSTEHAECRTFTSCPAFSKTSTAYFARDAFKEVDSGWASTRNTFMVKNFAVQVPARELQIDFDTIATKEKTMFVSSSGLSCLVL